MKFNELSQIIETTQNVLQYKALQTVNQLLVVRNWLIGYHIVEYEQNGEDRATYGQQIVLKLAEQLKLRKLKGFSHTNLKLYRQLYKTYPQLIKPIAKLLTIYLPNFDGFQIRQIESGEFRKSLDTLYQLNEIGQIQSDQFETDADKLLEHFSFSHFVHLLTVRVSIKIK